LLSDSIKTSTIPTAGASQKQAFRQHAISDKPHLFLSVLVFQLTRLFLRHELTATTHPAHRFFAQTLFFLDHEID